MSEYEYGEEIEVRVSADDWKAVIFLAFFPNGMYIATVESMEHQIVSAYKEHRKIAKPKPPEHIPYTQETFKEHRDKWFNYKNSDDDTFQIKWYGKNGVTIGLAQAITTWKDFFIFYEQETKAPCGTLKGEG